jgi:hypothetical protein
MNKLPQINQKTINDSLTIRQMEHEGLMEISTFLLPIYISLLVYIVLKFSRERKKP